MRQSGQNQEFPQGKTKVSTTVRTETKTITDNGFKETTFTTITTDHFSDGSNSTRTETQTTREQEILVGGIGIQRQEAPVETNKKNSLNTSGSGHQVEGHALALDPHSPKAELKTDDSFIQQAVACHNKHRAKHSSQPLVVSEELCKVAQHWANHLCDSGKMENSHYGYGENIYWTSAPGQRMKGDVPADYWYNEISNFNWDNMDFQQATGAFTQVVWKSSKEFGIAKASNAKGTYVVAFYIPAGNVLGRFHENVTKGTS